MGNLRKNKSKKLPNLDFFKAGFTMVKTPFLLLETSVVGLDDKKKKGEENN